MNKRDLVDRLEAIVSRACALSLGEPASGTIDEKAMIQDFSDRCHEVGLLAAEMVPDLERMEVRLKATLSQVPESVRQAATAHRFENIKWRPDPTPMPREIAAFVVLDGIEAARRNCLYLLARARYEELQRGGPACDCSARLEAGFLTGRPLGPLRLLDSIGVPFAAMDYLWICKVCGQKWSAEEAHDDMGEHTSWRAAAVDATRA